MNNFEVGYTAVEKFDNNSRTRRGWNALFAAWVLVTAATLGSLFFSEVMDVPVCVLCWYQRIAMYPLVIMLAIGLFPFDARVIRYAWPLAAIGWLISVYQLLLIAGIVPEQAQPCVQGVPCSETHVAVLGIFNIPSLSLITFSLVGILFFYLRKVDKS
jgi:disulfide bond formation protein DsbB